MDTRVQQIKCINTNKNKKDIFVIFIQTSCDLKKIFIHKIFSLILEFKKYFYVVEGLK